MNPIRTKRNPTEVARLLQDVAAEILETKDWEPSFPNQCLPHPNNGEGENIPWSVTAEDHQRNERDESTPKSLSAGRRHHLLSGE